MSCLIRFIFIGSCYCIRRTCNVYYKILLLVKLFLLNIPHGKIQTGGGNTKISLGRKSKIYIGNNVNFANKWEVGYPLTCYLRVKKQGVLQIGNNVGINSTSIFCDESITIMDYVHIGGGCQIFDTNFHNMDYLGRRDPLLNPISRTSPVLIERDVFIGSRCIICKGVTIGARSIVAAGSVVVNNIPPDELWGGNPAKFIKKINQK